MILCCLESATAGPSTTTVGGLGGKAEEARAQYLREYLPIRARQVELINNVEGAANSMKSAAMAIGGAVAAKVGTRHLVDPLGR